MQIQPNQPNQRQNPNPFMFDEESQLDSSEAKQEGHTKRLRSKSANIVEKD